MGWAGSLKDIPPFGRVILKKTQFSLNLVILSGLPNELVYLEDLWVTIEGFDDENRALMTFFTPIRALFSSSKPSVFTQMPYVTFISKTIATITSKARNFI